MVAACYNDEYTHNSDTRRLRTVTDVALLRLLSCRLVMAFDDGATTALGCVKTALPGTNIRVLR